MSKKITIREKFFKKLFRELDQAYSSHQITLAYARKVLKHYGLDLGKIAKAHAMAERSIHKKEERLYSSRKKKNPPERIIEIYPQIDAIQATKGETSLWPNTPFEHKFKPGSGIYGLPRNVKLLLSSGQVINLPDGSILIANKRGKMLHKSFTYDSDVDGIKNE